MREKHVIKYFAGSGPERSASCSFTLLFPNIDLTILKISGKEKNVNNSNYLRTITEFKEQVLRNNVLFIYF